MLFFKMLNAQLLGSVGLLFITFGEKLAIFFSHTHISTLEVISKLIILYLLFIHSSFSVWFWVVSVVLSLRSPAFSSVVTYLLLILSRAQLRDFMSSKVV